MFSSPGAIAFEIGPLVIRWYGILMATSIVVGLWLAYRQAKREGLPADDIIACGQWAILAGLVGARLYEVAYNWDYYGRYPSKIIAVWEGGLAIHGGLILGPLVGAWLAYRWKVPVLRGLDVAAPSIALGQAIGRWGTSSTRRRSGGPPTCRGSFTSRPCTGPSASASTSTSTRRFFTSRSGTWWCSGCSSAGSAHGSPAARAPSSSATSASTRSAGSRSRRSGSTASGSAPTACPSSRACSA